MIILSVHSSPRRTINYPQSLIIADIVRSQIHIADCTLSKNNICSFKVGENSSRILNGLKSLLSHTTTNSEVSRSHHIQGGAENYYNLRVSLGRETVMEMVIAQ